ncbi:response regulator [bacterium]|nr:response regulator [bacterium]
MEEKEMEKKVLIIEDDRFLGDLLAGHLKKSGLSVDLCPDARMGLEKIHAKVPALLVLDLLLPDMNGFELLEKLREEKIVPPLSVMILSNLGQKAEIERAMGLGAKDFLIKAHFDLDSITEKVKKMLSQTP